MWSQESAMLEHTQEQPSVGVPAKSYFCVPGVDHKSRSRGVEISYDWSDGGDIGGITTEGKGTLGTLRSFEKLNYKLYIPVLMKPDWKILLGYAYQPERFNFSNVGPEIQPLVANFQNKYLRSNAYSITSSKSLNERNYIGVRAKIAFNGDYDKWMSFDKRYMTINAMGLFGIKKSEDFEWGFGVYYSKNMRRSIILPFAMMHKNFNDKWGIEVAPPAYLYLRHNINEKSILLFGGEFSSRIYAFDTQKLDAQSIPAEYTLNHGEINAMITLEQQLIPWVWFSVKGGYQFGIRSQFETKAIPDANFRINMPDAPFLQMAIFLSPPDHLK